ncbi:MAG TPA: HD domain-containing protein [Thermotogota bacterium]|nr:HD domain-containing protein [Thermotogota bacterium]HPR95141.1 HD domain-containing protein [Thermotogota bacterium]
MPSLKNTLLRRSKQLYKVLLIPIILFLVVVFSVLTMMFFRVESSRMDALTELYITKTGTLFQEIEDLFNPALKTLLEREFETGFDSQAVERIKSDLFKIEYDTLEIEAINYYRFSDHFVIYDTDFQPDLGLEYSKWTFFTETVAESVPGTVFLRPLARETNTDLIRLYAYVKMPDNTIFELGIRFREIDDMIERIGNEVFGDSVSEIRIFKGFNSEESALFKQSETDNQPIYVIQNVLEGEYYISKDSSYGRYNIAIKVKIYFRLFVIFSVIVLISLVLMVAYLMRRVVLRLSDTLTQPIQIVENNMKGFNVKKTDYQIEEVQSDVFELQSIHDSFKVMKDEIVNAYDEMNAMNEELEDAYMENQNLMGKVDNLINLPDFLNYINDIETFILKSFEKIYSLIGDVDYAFAAIFEDDSYRYLDFKGLDIDLMTRLHLPIAKYAETKKAYLGRYERGEFAEKSNIPEIRDKLLDIRQMISIPINSQDNFIGIISLYTNDEEGFTDDDLRIATYFSNYLKGYLTISELSELEKDVQRETILGIIKLLEKHDPYTKGHSENVARLASAFAEFLELDEKTVQDIYWAGIVHDIGKIIIPHNILNKPSRLTEDEFRKIRRHPEYAYDALKENTHMKGIATMIRHHHERYDGAGYPDRLAGEAIPYESRIITVADSWDAMTSERVYKKGMSSEDALQELIKFSGKQFDPVLVKKWIEFINKNNLKKQK